ncbi:MAG TPA: glycosyltransferase [Verrucomicrobiae bacterium]|jgi:glycosyltransferase involved in cell wall biosynthesis
MKNLLLLAFYFPPRSHIASYRSGCFAKFLPENGWRPTVVCEDWTSDRADFDPDFVGKIPDEVAIHRVANPAAHGFYQRFLLRKIAPYLVSHRAPVLWWRKARAQVLALLERTRFDAVWATSDPLTPWALASEAAARAGIPWVADIRDSFNEQGHGSWYKRPAFAFQERRLARKAARVVAVTRGVAQRLGERIGRSVDVIYNGFDPTLFPTETPAAVPRFTIIYAGSLMLPLRNPAPFFEAVERCLAQKWIPAGEIELQFYGSDPRLIEQVFPRATERIPLKVLPRIPHRDVLRLMQASSVLLMLDNATEKDVLPGKIGDYLGARRPILAFPNAGGELAGILRRTGTGVAVSGVEALAGQIREWFMQWKSGGILAGARDEAQIEPFSRRFGARQLAGILDEISGPIKSRVALPESSA